MVLSNAILYNAPDTPYSKVAQKLRSHADKILAELEHIRIHHAEAPQPLVDPSEAEADPPRLTIGDLEPPLESLEALISPADITQDMDTSSDTDPLAPLFNFEFTTEQPASTPAPSLSKPKRDRKAERERARRRRAEANRARTRSSAGDPRENSYTSEHMDLDLVDGQLHEVHDDDKKRKRPKIVLPGHADVPPVVDEVDGREMFMKFDVGWILPDSSRRGGRAPVDRQPIEPRRKKPKAGECGVVVEIHLLNSV